MGISDWGKQFKYGDRAGMRAAVVIGPDEQAKGMVAIKDLRSGEQQVIPQTEVVEAVKKLIA